MNRVSKVILIALCTIAILAAVAFGGLWSYVHSDRARGQLEEALGKALKVPVKFQKIAVELPSTVRVESVASLDTGAAGQPRITATALHGTLAIRPLLSGDFEIRDVVLENPTLEWPQNEEGKWIWPSRQKKEGVAPKEPKAEHTEAEGGRKRTLAIRGVKLENGTVTLFDAKQEPVIAAAGVTTQFSEISGEQLTGTVAASRVTWTSKYVFENMRTSLRYADDALVLDGFEAESFGGTVRGRLQMDTRKEGQPFQTHVELAGVDLNGFATVSGWKDGEISGRLSGTADIAGRTDRFARMEGPGRVSIENGRFKKLELFDAIAYALDLNDLANLRPRDATLEFKFRDEKMFIDSLVLATDNLRIDAHGVARFDGKLALDARLSVSERFAATLPEFARGSFARQQDGRYGLDFKIGGKTDRPKTDLAEKLIGTKVQDKVVDLLGGLFGTKPAKNKNGEKPQAEGERRNP